MLGTTKLKNRVNIVGIGKVGASPDGNFAFVEAITDKGETIALVFNAASSAKLIERFQKASQIALGQVSVATTARN